MTLPWQKHLRGQELEEDPWKVSQGFVYLEVPGHLGEESFSALLGRRQDGLRH